MTNFPRYWATAVHRHKKPHKTNSKQCNECSEVMSWINPVINLPVLIALLSTQTALKGQSRS